MVEYFINFPFSLSSAAAAAESVFPYYNFHCTSMGGGRTHMSVWVVVGWSRGCLGFSLSLSQLLLHTPTPFAFPRATLATVPYSPVVFVVGLLWVFNRKWYICTRDSVVCWWWADGFHWRSSGGARGKMTNWSDSTIVSRGVVSMENNQFLKGMADGEKRTAKVRAGRWDAYQQISTRHHISP